ncbi:MAG: hypothetical protein NTV89_18560, partial [Proteobacteria bacterium]|nr:hypothetical protein [Pseudomonadota bacterium]
NTDKEPRHFWRVPVSAVSWVKNWWFSGETITAKTQCYFLFFKYQLLHGIPSCLTRAQQNQ